MILVIGYGNPLRGDDGIGQVLAEQLAAHFAPDVLQTLPCFQLTPELAQPISTATAVLFIDANVHLTPYTVQYQRVLPESSGALAHHVTPSSLLALAAQLYGRVPPAGLISIGISQLDYSTELSPTLRECVPHFLDYVEDILRKWWVLPAP
jgi:hydrogenase maturation protease